MCSCRLLTVMLVLPLLLLSSGIPLPTDRVYDGKDMSDVLLLDSGKSKHEVLFM